MDINVFKADNLLNIKEATSLVLLNKQQVYELQVILDFLGYKLGKLDGILGDKTKRAFAEFKRDTFQVDPNLIGSGSISILLKLLDEEKDEIEEEKPHPNQPIFEELLPEPITISNINWSDFNSPVSNYFILGEILRYDRNRIPNSNLIKSNILKLAKELDKIRIAWGGPIGVTSGYRPPAVNRRVGGARFSQHLTGNAVDIFPIGRNCREFEQWLDKHWYGALGLASNRGFCHIDMRNGKGWKTGGAKAVRWTY